MRILALDCSTEACSAAVLSESGLVGLYEEAGRSHAARILDMVDAVLAEAGVALQTLDGIAAGVGPGAFTGVRIGVAVAQGLAFGAGLPVVAVSSLEALALPAMAGGVTQALACLDARMGEVYWGFFRADARRGLIPCGAAAVAAPARVGAPVAGPFAGVGRGFSAYPFLQALPGLILPDGACESLPDARHMARLGALRLAAGEGIDPSELTPQYVREKVALTEVERAAAKAGALPKDP